ncbi:MAG TPA: helix-turn-helix transcriptional regulator [Bacillota bacterium]|nr:helix-turn-helix transcriptional regulator [Bacillota bacterium]
MKSLNKQHEDLMKLLDDVPGVEDHMRSFEVQMAERILERRLQIGLTQTQVVDIVREQGGSITQATISKVECGDATVGSDTYNKVLKALGGVANLSIEFGELATNSNAALEYKHA